ncbi:MAG: nucleoside triphosphate pyrophosphatase [Burkholderiaceae bacterium]
MIWLASSSPRRAELLTQLGVTFEKLLPDDPLAAEALEAERQGEPPNQYVLRVTLAKLELAANKRREQQLIDRPILAADTTIALGGRILGKPQDTEHNALMLRTLSGRTHRVLTAVAVGRGPRIEHCVHVSRVWFARLSPDTIAEYVATGEGLDKAGGYGIQGSAARFVRKIEGSYSGIMGLPLYETARLLRC